MINRIVLHLTDKQTSEGSNLAPVICARRICKYQHADFIVFLLCRYRINNCFPELLELANGVESFIKETYNEF